VRDAYGRNSFGQGCLMARRLIEAGITFVEVQSSGWDTHGNELPTLKKLIPPVDQGMAALLADLRQRGLLDDTLVIWMGEFGRMPRINLTAGRDHFPKAFNMAMAGCGVKGGNVIGATDKLGTEVIERPVLVADLFCTFCQALGINPRKENQSNVGRPIKIVEEGETVKEVFG
jgi:arylsulfatase A-like enzyme